MALQCTGSIVCLSSCGLGGVCKNCVCALSYKILPVATVELQLCGEEL